MCLEEKKRKLEDIEGDIKVLEQDLTNLIVRRNILFKQIKEEELKIQEGKNV